MELSQAKQIMRVANDALREIEDAAAAAREQLANGYPSTAASLIPLDVELETARNAVRAIEERWEEIRALLWIESKRLEAAAR